MNGFLLSFALCFIQVLCTQNGAGPVKTKTFLPNPMGETSPVIVPTPVFTPVQQYPIQQYPQLQVYPVQQYPQLQQYPVYQYVPAQQYPYHHHQHHHHRPHYNHYYPQFGNGYPC